MGFHDENEQKKPNGAGSELGEYTRDVIAVLKQCLNSGASLDQLWTILQSSIPQAQRSGGSKLRKKKNKQLTKKTEVHPNKTGWNEPAPRLRRSNTGLKVLAMHEPILLIPMVGIPGLIPNMLGPLKPPKLVNPGRFFRAAKVFMGEIPSGSLVSDWRTGMLRFPQSWTKIRTTPTHATWEKSMHRPSDSVDSVDVQIEWNLFIKNLNQCFTGAYENLMLQPGLSDDHMHELAQRLKKPGRRAKGAIATFQWFQDACSRRGHPNPGEKIRKLRRSLARLFEVRRLVRQKH